MAILPAVIGSWLNLSVLDPILGLLIGVAIVFITWEAIVSMWFRLMNTVDPHLLDHAELAILSHSKVSEIDYLKMRWIGHCLYLESSIKVQPEIDLMQIRTLQEELKHSPWHEVPHLAGITISVF